MRRSGKVGEGKFEIRIEENLPRRQPWLWMAEVVEYTVAGVGGRPEGGKETGTERRRENGGVLEGRRLKWITGFIKHWGDILVGQKTL